jgi:hypothetical protein
MNLFQMFQNLIPKATQIVAIVQGEFPDGTTLCLTLDNQPIRVKGVKGRAQGEKVFVTIDPALGASISGDAPDLPAFSVTI